MLYHLGASHPQPFVSGSLPQVKKGSAPPSLIKNTSSIQQRSFSLPSVLLEWHQKIAVAVEGNGPAVVFDKRLGNSLGT